MNSSTNPTNTNSLYKITLKDGHVFERVGLILIDKPFPYFKFIYTSEPGYLHSWGFDAVAEWEETHPNFYKQYEYSSL